MPVARIRFATCRLPHPADQFELGWPGFLSGLADWYPFEISSGTTVLVVNGGVTQPSANQLQNDGTCHRQRSVVRHPRNRYKKKTAGAIGREHRRLWLGCQSVQNRTGVFDAIRAEHRLQDKSSQLAQSAADPVAPGSAIV